MGFEFFVAKRIYSNSKGGKRISRPAVRIAMMGIAIGLTVMIVSLAVVMGFKKEVCSKVVGFGSHLQVISLTQTRQFEIMPILTNDSLRKVIGKYKEIDHVQEYASKLGILKTEDDFAGVTFKGVGENYDTAFFHHSLVEGCVPKFSSKESTNSILISRRIASCLGLSLGSQVYAYFVDKNSGMRARRFKVKGIYESNMAEYDKVNVLTDIYTVRKLNGWDSDMSSGYEMTTRDFEGAQELAARMHNDMYGPRDRNGVLYGVFSIKELAPHTFSWLAVLDMNVIMILVLMLCVSSVTIVSGLLIIMLERINMIGVFKALGATNQSVRKVFVHYSVFLVGKGMLIGDILGLLVCFVQKQYQVIKLDSSVYYLDSVPIQIDRIYIIGLNILTLVISSIVVMGASYLVSISKPSKTMRFV